MDVGLITPDEFTEISMKKNVCIIDVREKDAYKVAHIENAINIPGKLFEEADNRYNPVMCRLRRYEAAGYDIVLYCDKGNTSMRCAGILKGYGISCYSLYGGISMYKNTLTETKK